jgi:hypothetical protein
MKALLCVAIALVILSSLPVKAAQATANAQASAGAAANAQAGQTRVDANSSASASADSNLRPAQGELVGKIDSKSARVGDQVVLKTREKMVTANGTVIPKGSRLVGHVTDVQAHSGGHADSSLSFAFDRAELKNGQSVAIQSVIRAVAPPATMVAAGSMDGDSSMGMAGGGMAGGPHSMGAVRSGGGLAGGALGSATAVTGGAVSTVGSTTGSALHATGDVAGQAAAGAGNAVHGAAGAAGSLGASATAIPGVMLRSEASGAASGTLTASKRNVHLDSGTQFTLGIAAAATSAR